MTQKQMILGLIVVTFAVGAYAVFKAPQNFNQVLQRTMSATPTPASLKRTGTFVDTMVGRIVYFAGGHFYELMLPNQTVKQIAGVDANLIENFPAVRPAWSSDSKLFAFVVDTKTIAVVTYATGSRYSLISLTEPLDLSKPVNLSFAPDNTQLLIKTDLGAQAGLRFFDAKSGSELYSNAACLSTGVWLAEAGGYATTCTQNGKDALVLLSPTAATKIKVIASAQQYELLNAYDKSSLVVKRGNDAGKMTLSGAFAMIEASRLKSFPSLEAIRDPQTALATRIQKEKQTEAIDDVQVANDSSYVIYHTKKGLWIEDLRLHETPYFLIEGTLPSVMP